tara:strand:- start:105 stop:1004 length:900 start_codon:yes stop_codon:yes gene_type:complete
MKNLKVVEKKEVKNILSFNPVSNKQSAFTAQITAVEAQHILDYHNNDNRKLCPSQVNKITKSVVDDGWQFDGNPVIFNTKGNITESQHRLTFIANSSDPTKKYDIVVVLGAAPDSFSNTAIGKPRRPHDEIYRKDNSALSSQTAILGDLLNRTKDKRLSMTNAVTKWNDWKDYIIEGSEIIDSFLSNTEDFNSQRKTIGAWATLCIRNGYKEVAEKFLEMWEEEVNKTGTYKLTSDFMDYWKEQAWSIGQEPKLSLIYKLLCVSTDKLLKSPDGVIALDISLDKLEYKTLKGTYKKFLV